MKKIFLLLIPFIFFACQNKDGQQAEINDVSINEIYQTERNEADNIDSPAFWSYGENNWVIATAKSGNVLVVTKAEDGSFVKRVGSEGIEPGQFKRPNGICVIDSLCIIVERDNKRVQVLSLPEFKSLGFISDSLLRKPYGLSTYKKDNVYNLYVTDNYETADEQIPPPEQLDKRIHYYTFTVSKNKLEWELQNYFGSTKGEGVLSVVESIFADTLNNQLLLSEEDMNQSEVKVYNLQGQYTGKTFGAGYFTGQVEGIALWENKDGSGYWIIADQSYEKNMFHVFKRKTLEYAGTFSGPKTTNTDGIWITGTSFGNFKSGAFFAVHNDGNVSAFDWSEIVSKLKLEVN